MIGVKLQSGHGLSDDYWFETNFMCGSTVLAHFGVRQVD
jgi:hypothetical protein